MAAARAVVLLVALSFLSTGFAPGQQPTKKPTEWTPDLLLRVKQISQVVPSPDGKRVAFTVKSAVTEGDKSNYLTHIHLADASGGNPVVLTQGDKSCDHPRWSPDGGSIAFLSNRVGKKNVWLVSAKGGEPERLTESATDVSSFLWSPDGKMVAYTALDPQSAFEKQAAKEKNDARVVDENPKQSRLHVVGVEKGKREPRLLTKENFSVASRQGYDWSPDGKRIVISHARTPRPEDWTSADLSIVDVETSKVQPLVKTAAVETNPLWSPDGQTIAYLSSNVPATWAGDNAVHVVAVSGGTPRPLAETFDRGGRHSELVGWSADGKRLFFTEARGTTVTFNVLPLNGPPAVLSKADGLIGGVHLNHHRSHVGFSFETASRPAEAHVAAIERFEPTAISKVNQELADLPVGMTETVRWKSNDNLEIEGLVTYPVGYEKGKRYPMLVIVHGGPMGVHTQGFVGAAPYYHIASFAARGYVVFRPNIRGSSGYGSKFRHANYGDWGGKDFQDMMTGVDQLIAQGVADPERLGIMGWSYGGYMTSWTITQTKRFKAASVGAGVTNLMSFTGTADIPDFLPDYFGGEFWDKPEAYQKHSAMFQVKGVTTPTLIQHGEKDDRVPLPQGQELYNALKRQGCTVQMVTYPRTPHGIEEPKLMLDCVRRNVEWFDKYVRAGK